jgi:hypothetical protein
METPLLAPIKPPGLTFDIPKPNEQAHRTLFKRKVAMDLGPESKINLTLEERKRMEKYEAPKATMWSSTDKDEPFPPKQTIFILNGLASNPDQLENDGSSLVHKIMEDMGEDAKNVNIVSISCPGFGDSKFTMDVVNDEVNGPKNTSVNEYVEVTKIWLKSMGLNPDNAVISGHSAGAEAAVHFLPSGFQVYALNPALHLGKSEIFNKLSILNQVSRYTQKFAPGLVEDIGQWITNKLVGTGKDNASKAQSNVHRDEEATHQTAFRYKSTELIDEDKLPEGPNGVLPLDLKKLRILITKGDILTPADQSFEWIKEWVRKGSPPQFEDEVLRKASSLIIPLDEELSTKSGHDALFINPNVADIFTKELSSFIKSRIQISEPAAVPIYTGTEVAKIIQPQRERVSRDNEQVKKLIMQGMTLEMWQEAAQLIIDNTQDHKVIFNDRDTERFMHLLWGHPAIQEHYKDRPAEFDAILNSGPKAMMALQELYFETNHSKPLYDIFHFYDAWGPDFGIELLKHPEITNKLPGGDKPLTILDMPSMISNILVNTRVGISSVFNQLAIYGGKHEIAVNDDIEALDTYTDALLVFQKVVRDKFADTIAGQK